ncbi:hypothetical protein VNO77_41323 [Canavalia gladiata]|uniref:Late embryogenesis abundant protein LEA-2 subgroup domain-containing protein n=1 Tax=Canavalia gladiata TaxID=3824 RepID=A0AAN9PRJ7_CANGL
MFPIRKEEEKSSKCVVYALVTIATLLGVVCFSSIFLVVRDPKIELISARLVDNINHTVISASSPFNLSMIGRVSLWNPNFGRFYYDNTTVSVMYGDFSIGASELGGAILEAREIKEFNSIVNMRFSEELVNLTNDISSCMLKLRSHSDLSGIGYVLKFIKKRKTIQMDCTMNLDLTSSSLRLLQC